MVLHTMDNTLMDKNKEKENMCGLIALNMMENGKIIIWMDM